MSASSPHSPAAFPAETSPADTLLKLVPADAGATLVVSDLRSQSRVILESPLAEGFRASGYDTKKLIDSAWDYQRRATDPRRVWYPG